MQVRLEIRSVNNRYLDLHLRMPDELRFFEPHLRSQISERLSRGKLDIRLQLQQHSSATAPSLPDNFLLQTQQHLAHIRTILPDTLGPSYSELYALAAQAHQPDTESWLPVLNDLLAQALDELLANKKREGQQLALAMQGFAQQMLEQIDIVAEQLPLVQKQYQEKVAERLREALELASPEGFPSISGEEFSARIAQEAAAFSMRIDVAEELTRLNAHVKELFHLLEVNEQSTPTNSRSSSLGKRLDFLCQEMNREANTLGSKAGSIALTQAAIELKLLIEQLREQAQNIE